MFKGDGNGDHQMEGERKSFIFNDVVFSCFITPDGLQFGRYEGKIL